MRSAASACPTSPCRAVPFTGWNLYREPHPAGELADRDGLYLAFAATRDARWRGDPRPSIAERYNESRVPVDLW